MSCWAIPKLSPHTEILGTKEYTPVSSFGEGSCSIHAMLFYLFFEPSYRWFFLTFFSHFYPQNPTSLASITAWHKDPETSTSDSNPSRLTPLFNFFNIKLCLSMSSSVILWEIPAEMELQWCQYFSQVRSLPSTQTSPTIPSNFFPELYSE